LFLLKPPGGVKEGQMFLVPFSSGDLNNGSTVIADGATIMTEGTPFLLSGHYAAPDPTQGRWKSSLFDCFRYGLFHPSLWNAVCCPQLLMAQVLTRLRLDWRGDPTTESHKTFPTVLGIVIAYFLLSVILAPRKNDDINDNNYNNQDDAYIAVGTLKHSVQSVLYNTLYLAFAVYTWLVLTKLRTVVRLRYAIPPASSSSVSLRGGSLQQGAATAGSLCGGIGEDLCISFWCGCCSVAQMARQTAEYDVQSAACCSRTGLVTNPSAAFPSSVLNV
jgi:PLAC8 family